MSMFKMPDLRQAHAKFLREFEIMTYRVAESATHLQRKDVTARLSHHVRTGHLLEKTESKLIRTSKRHIVVLKNGALKGAIGYASFLDKGTGPHIIRARRARALRFMYQGKFIFRRWVFHRGTPEFLPFTLAHQRAFVYAGTELTARMNALAARF